MTTVVTLASRRAAPISPTAQADELHLIQLHAQACTSLREALRQLQAPTTANGTHTWAAATARAHRGLTALKQASALAQQVGG